MQRRILAGLGKHLTVTALAAGWLVAAVAASNLLSPEDTAFVRKAIQGSLAEVALGGIAAERASNEQVRGFADRMIKDHSEVNEKLIALAGSKGCEVPTTLSSDQEQLLERMRTADATAFDRQYVKAMVREHEADVAEFTRQAKEADDPDLRRFAEQTLPTLQSHLDAIRDIEESL